MALPPPRLEDRSFQDLVDDAKRFVQQRCPEWTDHNVSDPGVTLIETFASMTDQLLYRLNRVPDRHFVKFLELIGVNLFPPTAANVSQLRLLGDGAELRTSDLTVGFVRGSLRALPAFNCLAYGLNTPRRSAPIECRYNSVTYALSHDLFWNRGDFTVMNGNVQVAACLSAEGICEFDLP